MQLISSAILFSATLAAAQYGDSGSSSTASSAGASSTASAAASSSNGTTIKVSDAGGKIVFDPSSLTAAKGENVTFSFWPMNHSVVQSSFDAPCAPLDGGFYSGFLNVSAEVAADARPTFTITVEDDTKPIWFYCSQGKHCQGGMVGVINEPKSGAKTLNAYKDASKQAKNNTSPDSSEATGGSVGTTADQAAGDAAGNAASPSGTGAANATASGSAANGLTVGGAGAVGFAGILGLVLAAF